jgi:lipopolysaccharide/colanic/teichoic acid biosynthesis glycosyltransferase
VWSRERTKVVTFNDFAGGMTMAERARTEVAAEHPSDVFETSPSPPAAWGDWRPGPLQRAVEIVLASLALLVTAPLMLLIAVAIRIDSPGSPLFVQRRVGVHGKLFRFYKFRSLYVDARQRFPELYAYQYSPEELSDLKFKVDRDPRVTRIGDFLRRSSLDELPNFVNVIKGDMALVGPRPEIPEMLPYYRGEMLLKFSVRPGVTGPAQVSGRGRLKFHDTVAYDLEYVRRRSWRYDMRLLVTTVKKVLLRDGAF